MINGAIFDVMLEGLERMEPIAEFLTNRGSELVTNYHIGHMRGSKDLGLTLKEGTLQFGYGELWDATHPNESKVRYGPHDFGVEINADQSSRQSKIWSGTGGDQGLPPPHLFRNHQIGRGTWEFSEKVNKYGAENPFEGGGFDPDEKWSYMDSVGFYDEARERAVFDVGQIFDEYNNFLVSEVVYLANLWRSI